MSNYKCETCGKDKTPSETVLDEIRKATLLGVIRQLNQNTYNLTKEECIEEVRAMLASLPPTSLDADLALTLTAENQKRLETEQQRDQLLAALKELAGSFDQETQFTELTRARLAIDTTTQAVEGGAA